MQFAVLALYPVLLLAVVCLRCLDKKVLKTSIDCWHLLPLNMDVPWWFTDPLTKRLQYFWFTRNGQLYFAARACKHTHACLHMYMHTAIHTHTYTHLYTLIERVLQGLHSSWPTRQSHLHKTYVHTHTYNHPYTHTHWKGAARTAQLMTNSPKPPLDLSKPPPKKGGSGTKEPWAEGQFVLLMGMVRVMDDGIGNVRHCALSFWHHLTY